MQMNLIKSTQKLYGGCVPWRGGLQPSLPPAAMIFHFSVLEAVSQCPWLTQAAASGPKDEAEAEFLKRPSTCEDVPALSQLSSDVGLFFFFYSIRDVFIVVVFEMSL